MPPKGKKGGGAKDNKSGEEQREEPLQAVVFADSFETRFNPFVLEKPRCLLTLANTPLIEYTLEFLAGAGAEEVFLYCGNHTEAVEEYLQESKWTTSTSPFSLELIKSTSRSVGDCMRDLDQKGLIVGDFICVYGDVVANIPLESALAAHRARREKDKKSIMTVVLREAGGYHRTKSSHIRPTFVLDAETGRCVHYEQIRPGHNATLDVPGEVLKDHVELEIREDLIDCGIDICTPEVLAQYNDNFDWQLPRTGFLRGVLKDFETFQLMIHTHVLTEGYAARVKNLQAYDAISKDVISRWTYPLTPDTNLVSHQSFQLYKGNVYREDGVVLARSSIVNRRVVLGKATSVGDHSRITNSVIGRRCVIGKRVKIDGAYIWDDARIGDDTVIETAIVANEASIGKHCTVKAGALISYGVHIADNMTVAGNQRISTLKRKRGFEHDEIVQAESNPKVVGEAGIGYHLELDEDEEEASEGLLLGIQTLDLAVDDISTLDSDEDSDVDRHDFHHARSNSTRSDSFASIDSEESGETRRQARDFHKEAVNSLYDDLEKGADPDTMQMEFKPLILAANAQDNNIRRALAVGFNRRIASLVESGKPPKEAVSAVLPRYKQLINSYLSDHDEQAEYLLFVQTDLVHRPQGEKVLHQLAFSLAMNDLVDAEGFEQWWNDPKSSASEELKAVRLDTKQVVDFLCASSDEEDSDEEEEDSDEDLVAAFRRHIRSYCHTTHPTSYPPPPISPPLLLVRFVTQDSVLFAAGQLSHSQSPHTPAVSILLRAQPHTSFPSGSSSFGEPPHFSPTTPSKRKLDDTTIITVDVPSADQSLPQRKASKTWHNKEGALTPQSVSNTPQTIPMDNSDDDFNSQVSSDDMDMNDDASSVDFGAADSDVDLEEEFQDDGAFDTQDRDLKPQQKAYMVDYTVYSPQDIQSQQDCQIADVANLLEQPHEATAILLRYGRWNKERLIEQYMDKQEEVLDKAGLGQDIMRDPPRIETVKGFTCDICCEDESGLQNFAMKCGHRFCVSCYRQYLAQKIREEGEAARIKCPGDGCNNIVDAKSLDLLVTPDLTDRYHELLNRTYVDDKENLKWCPAPECIYAIECGVKKRDLTRIVPTVHCECKHAFCFGCSLPDHQPTPCSLVKRWLKKCEDDSETANWISANTKECPKCQSTIEKNGGCNHMTCRKCRNEFCWICMGLWSEHGTSWYNCNRYEEKSGSDARDAQAKSRQSLERYLHYYNRYANHEQSARLDKDIYHKTEKKMQLLQNQSGLSWIEVQFLEQASHALQECRQTLKWTYAFAYYLARNNQTEIFEDNQKDLEMAVENLSEMFEKPTEQLAGLKVEMMDKTAYCNRRRVIVLDDTAENLKKGNWDFNVELS